MQIDLEINVSAIPASKQSGVHSEALRATPLDSEYKTKRNERATKVIQEYFKYNLSPEHQCKTENCKGGLNHCCSMCKLVKGIEGTSKLEESVTERIDEFATGVLFGGCVQDPDDSGQTPLDKLIELHKAHPPSMEDADDFDMFAQPIFHDKCPKNTYQSSITRQAFWEVRHERPDIVPEELTTALLQTVKDMLARDDNALLRENLYIVNGGEDAAGTSLVDVQLGARRGGCAVTRRS